MSKKIILFIVEGLSDKDALEPILSELIDDTNLYFEVLYCDATTNNDIGYLNKNMKQIVAMIVKNYLNLHHEISKKDIEKNCICKRY
ncbi:MAG: hypothetical protein RR945_02295 [Erysipelotrichaceae bacterium]